MNFETKYRGRTLTLEFYELQLEFCLSFVPLPKHMALSDHDETLSLVTANLTCKKKSHPSAILTAGLELWIITRGWGGNITWNSKGTFIQIQLILESHRNMMEQLNSIMPLSFSTTGHPYTLASFHISEHFIVHHTVTITHSDCTLHSMIGSLCFTVYLEHFVFNVESVQVMASESQCNK